MTRDTFDLLSVIRFSQPAVPGDLQGHGRTADIDRPIDVQFMADDIAAQSTVSGWTGPDLVGYS
jgi:hypothetical protein